MTRPLDPKMALEAFDLLCHHTQSFLSPSMRELAEMIRQALLEHSQQQQAQAGPAGPAAVPRAGAEPSANGRQPGT